MHNYKVSNFKCILHSKRANIFYLEHCRVMQKDGRVLYLTKTEDSNLYFNIPIANTSVIILGSGTSITQSAVRMLSSAGVLIGFSGAGATPLYSGNSIEWFSPQNEYRPTNYLQGWMSFWFDDTKRFNVAKKLQKSRLIYLEKVWNENQDFINAGLYYKEIETIVQDFYLFIEKSKNINDLLSSEAVFIKQLYKYTASSSAINDFSRDYNNSNDLANDFLNYGNYLAYGFAASTLWVLGIPHGFAVLHGKTRRGALIFDIADLIKCAIVLPWAFISSKDEMSENQFKNKILENFTSYKSLDYMFDFVKDVSLNTK